MYSKQMRVFMLIGCLIALSYFHMVLGQSGQPMSIAYMDSDKVPPAIQITNVYVNDSKVSLNQSFHASDENWLKKIKLDVTNSSGRVITHIHLALLLHHPKDKANPRIASNNNAPTPSGLPFGGTAVPFMFFGRDTRIPNITSPSKLLPGEKITVSSEDYQNNMLPRILDWSKLDLKYVTGATILVRSVVFEDNTSWIPGKYFDKPITPKSK